MPQLVDPHILMYLGNLLIALACGFILWRWWPKLQASFSLAGTTHSVGVSLSSSVAKKAAEFRNQGFALSGALLLALLAFGLPFFLCLGVTALSAFLLPKILIRRAQRQLEDNFELHLPEALTKVATSLKAGLTIQKALELAVDSVHPVIGSEFEQTLKEYSLGKPIDEALERINQRVSSRSCHMAIGALVLGRRLGGNLPEILSHIAASVKEVHRVEGKLRSLTAQGRAQGVVLCSTPILFAVGMAIFAPERMELMTGTWVGIALLTLAGVLELIGIIVTWKILQLEV